MHSLISRHFLISLFCTLVFAISIPDTAYAVDGCAAAGFKIATNMNVEASPFGIAVADFNGDGHLDVVISPNNSSNELVMLFGRGGSGKFDAPVAFPAGGQALKLTAADFNGDGKPDLAVSLSGGNTPPGRLSILLNTGAGQFSAPNIITIPGDPGLPVVGDVNNDGKLDIVTGLSTGVIGGSVAVLLGNGSGGFSIANSAFFTSSFNAAEVLIGDFNEDGKRDLAVPASSDGVDIYLGDGTGAFAPPIHVLTGVATLALTAGDFNNDGHLDLLGDTQMLLGTGMATFAAPIAITLPENTSAALAGDVNNDGHLDLLAGGTSGLTVFLGNGTGNLTRAKSYSSGFTIFGASSLFAALGDFNEDGKTDIAAVQRTGIGILEGDGTGAFNDALAYQASTNPRYLIAADFNNDGKQDFATIGPGFSGGFPASKVEVALGDGIGGFTRKSVTTFGGNLLAAIDAADFNGDGKLDLAVTQPSNGLISILLNDGTGGFLPNGFNAPFVQVSFQPWAIKAGDFNSDNKTDLFVIRRGANSYAVLNGDGSGGFVINSGGPLPGTNSFFDEVAVSDFNADNKLDVALIRSGANSVSVLQGNGTGQFFDYATASVPGIPISLVVGDLNGDTKPDIAVTSSALSQATVSVLINNGTGFNAATNYPSPAGGIPAIGDFNGDSKPDLAISSGAIQVGSNADGVVVLTNIGDGAFSAAVHFSVSPASDFLAVKDFNGDGKDDVVISQPGGNSVSLLLNNFTTAQPCLSLNDITIDEPDAGTVNAVFTVKLSAASTQTVRVNYFTLPTFGFAGAATQGADFERVSGSVTFLPGETTQTVNVPITGDLIDEPDQSVDLVLSTPLNALISDGQGRVTIIDNDGPPVLSINDVSVNEGTQTQSTATFTVSLNLPSEKAISVQFALAPGTASPGSDYPDFTGTVDFTPGVVSRTIIVPLVQDQVFEPDETFFVNLSNATNASIGDSQGQATILNDDPVPTITINAGSIAEGAAGTSGNLPLQVRLSNPSFQTITVSYSTAEGTATAGSDYTTTSGTVSFNPGEALKTINVAVLGDNVDEINETFSVNLTNPTNASISGAQAIGTILDDDGPTLSIDSVSVVEGQTGFKNAVFTVSLSAPSVQGISVNYTTSNGTAIGGLDYQSVNFQSLFIPAGATSGTINIRIFSDFNIEPDEQFFVNLLFPSNATIANGQGTGTIVNDDSNGKFQFSSQTYSGTEDAGNVVITVNRVDGATGIVTVDYATSNGTATAGSDYTATSGTLTFNLGETTKTFSLPIISDNVFEADETVNLTLNSPTGGAILGNPTTSVLTITTPPLFLALDESDSQKAAALESVWFMRDPFPVVSTLPLIPLPDRNTRVIIFVSNLQLAPGDLPSTVKVNLFDSTGQSVDVDAEDMRALPFGNFMQVRFRLPDNLHAGDCLVKVKAHNQESNSAIIKIKE